VTRFEVERILGGCTLVRAIPLSGRTNQIRVHLDYIGHPIVGDKVYKPRLPETAETDGAIGGAGAPLIRRHALHCRELRFMHPVTKGVLTLSAAYPDDMTRLIERLQAQAT
jgi:23S rRNA-/tRNA-specific pseudouridylate synthase